MKRRCNGCDTAVNSKQAVLLPGGWWSVNHYGGREGFFGWLALQPVAHRLTISDLTPDESRALGPAMQTLERGIKGYWQSKGWPVRRVYVMCFLEGQLDTKEELWHLHFHLVPRFEELDPSMRDKTDVLREVVPGIDAYLIGKLRMGHGTYWLPSELDRHLFKTQHGLKALEVKEFEIVKSVTDGLAGPLRATARAAGVYRACYRGGWNWRAVAATVIGCALAWGGLIVPVLKPLYSYAWFVGFLAAALLYWSLMRLGRGSTMDVSASAPPRSGSAN